MCWWVSWQYKPLYSSLSWLEISQLCIDTRSSHSSSSHIMHSHMLLYDLPVLNFAQKLTYIFFPCAYNSFYSSTIYSTHPQFIPLIPNSFNSSTIHSTHPQFIPLIHNSFHSSTIHYTHSLFIRLIHNSICSSTVHSTHPQFFPLVHNWFHSSTIHFTNTQFIQRTTATPLTCLHFFRLSTFPSALPQMSPLIHNSFHTILSIHPPILPLIHNILHTYENTSSIILKNICFKVYSTSVKFIRNKIFNVLKSISLFRPTYNGGANSQPAHLSPFDCDMRR
jgi:hypothetical protein